jgi:hypothetical protein
MILYFFMKTATGLIHRVSSATRGLIHDGNRLSDERAEDLYSFAIVSGITTIRTHGFLYVEFDDNLNFVRFVTDD